MKDQTRLTGEVHRAEERARTIARNEHMKHKDWHGGLLDGWLGRDFGIKGAPYGEFGIGPWNDAGRVRGILNKECGRKGAPYGKKGAPFGKNGGRPTLDTFEEHFSGRRPHNAARKNPHHLAARLAAWHATERRRRRERSGRAEG